MIDNKTKNINFIICFLTINIFSFILITEVVWPSGLRRQFKALVREGVGSNPTATIFFSQYLEIRYFQKNLNQKR